MNKNKIINFSIIFFIFLSILHTGCSAGNNKKYNIRSEINSQLGTITELSIYDGGSENVLTQAFDLISSLENSLSRNISSSEISEININAGISPVKVSHNTFFIIEKSIYYSELTNGLFDITIGPLVSLWGIGTEKAKIPSQKEIDTVLSLVDYKNIKLTQSDNSVFLEKKGMKIDLGAIAKGFIADKVCELFKQDGVKSAIINLGGNVMLLGKKPGGKLFKIGIQDPFDKRGVPLGIFEGENISIVTSGIYERYYEKDSIKYHHILDPKTGYPVDNDIMGISVITEKSVDGDALSTSLFMLGSKGAIDLVEKLKNVEIIVITKDKKILLSSGVGSNFTLMNSDFVLAEN